MNVEVASIRQKWEFTKYLWCMFNSFFSKMGLDKVFMKADQNPVGVRITSLFFSFSFFYRNKKVDNCPKKIHGAVLEQ